MKKIWIASIAGGVLIASWLGASIYGSRVTESELKTLASKPAGESRIRLKNLQHHAGFFSSDGRVEISLTDDCNEDTPNNEIMTAVVNYKTDNLILPTSLIRFDWNLQPTGKDEEKFVKLFGSKLNFEGHGEVLLDRAIKSNIHLPELIMVGNAEKLVIAPSSGNVAISGDALVFGWKTEKLTSRGGGQAIELQNIGMDVDMKNRNRGIGTSSFSVDKISTSLGSAEGFKFLSQVTEKADLLDMRLQPSLKSAQFNGQTLSNVAFEVGVTGIHGPSIEMILKLSGESCGFRNLTLEKDEVIRKAVAKILNTGFSVGIPVLKGTLGEGSIEGTLTVQLTTGGGKDVDLASHLKSNGHILLKGKALTDEQKREAVRSEFAFQTPEGIKAGFEYGDGFLKVNGRIFDGALVQTGLTSLSTGINTFINTPRLAASKKVTKPEPETETTELEEQVEVPTQIASTAPASLPEASTVVSATMTAQAPVVAAPAPLPPTAGVLAAAGAAQSDCVEVDPCVKQSLGAAQRKDLDSVRSLASKIDGLPKPDLGNRPVSRKLNIAGLEALKTDDYPNAVQYLRSAYKENPRDVEIAGNLGYALMKAGNNDDAVQVLMSALKLDPRRSSTWAPLAEALTLAGHKDEGLSALWISYQWSGNREKSLAFYTDHADKDRASRPAVAAMYSAMLGLAAQ